MSTETQSTKETESFAVVEQESLADGGCIRFGFKGSCRACGVSMVAADDGHFGRLECPSCGLVVGPTIFPSLDEESGEGEPADGPEPEWPYVSDKFGPVADAVHDGEGGAEVVTAASGLCLCGGSFRKNTAQSRYGATPLACDTCQREMGWAAQWSLIAAPTDRGVSEKEEIDDA